jgi:cysteinyl-tRNA synthetase
MQLYNTLTRRKEDFTPINAHHVGMYVCGPTVYGDPHLGHARSAITFDLLFRYLTHKGYKVRYVRNITDVGHLENDADHGEDKIAHKARIEQLEPMEVAQHYARRYHAAMHALGVLPPSIEPLASAHIMEQIALVQTILRSGYAYVADGSVYFDVDKYSRSHNYGKLSGRTIDDMLAGSRMLAGQEEKHSPADFALWKKAAPQHIMQWQSPWSMGFPGWHLECSAMSVKYLGERFDIHGGGMDLLFPHHECEIAQNTAAYGHHGAGLWMHNNMITINKQKMGKSLGNAISLEELFTGRHALLERAYNPMVVRFFIMQAHYRSTLDFSNEALQASEKGLQRLFESKRIVCSMAGAEDGMAENGQGVSAAVEDIVRRCYAALDDDLNSPIAIACLFDAAHLVNAPHTLTNADAWRLKQLFSDVFTDILGLAAPAGSNGKEDMLEGIIKLTLDLRQHAKNNKDYAQSDSIRARLMALGIAVKDSKDGSTFTYTAGE